MATPAIRVEGLGKRYRLAHGQERARYRTLRESLAGLVTAPFKKRGTVEEFWALNDVSFEVQPGEVVGIIGRNGAGKSTLLKVLSRITKPTTGRVEINGRVGSLLEVGTGFHPELTGRENIYLNGSILGMSRKEIDRRFDEIVAFAEVEKFLDTPVKRYSSGMYVRLAFAVAAHLEPEILIVDEVLAVGDAQFQQKCLDKMRECASSGRTVILVSHQMNSVRDLCGEAVWLDKGYVRRTGPTGAIVESYISDSTRQATPGVWIDLTKTTHTGLGSARMRAVRGYGARPDTPPIPDGPFHLAIRIESFEEVSGDMRVELELLDRFQTRLMVVNTYELKEPLRFQRGVMELTFIIANLHLAPGSYTVNLHVGDGEDLQDVVADALRVEVLPPPEGCRTDLNGRSLITRDFRFETQAISSLKR